MKVKFLIVAGPLACLAFLASQWHLVQAQGTISLTGCQVITTAGSYVLNNNVSSSGTCFSIRGSNITFDGNGKTISAGSGSDAVEVAHYSGTAPSNVVVKNFTSTVGVRTYGNGIHHVTFEDLTVAGITVYGSDDVTIQNNIVGSGGISVNDADADWPPYRPIIRDNTITGQVGHTTKILLEVAGGKYHPCPRIDAVLTNNTVINYRNDPPPEATANVRIRCATHSVFTGNLIRAYGTTMGLYIRDESDDGRYENNTFWVNDQEAIRSASGNDDKTFPARNIFRNNVFRSDLGKATYFQGIGVNNLFDYNIFWSATANDMINGGDGNTFDHNTFYTKNTGALINFDLDTDPADVFTNNIFSYSGTSIFGYQNFSAARHSSNTNLFQNRAGALSFGSYGGSLAAWRTATSNDLQSMETNPLFTDASTGDFTLGASSPARGAGTSGTDLGAIPYGNTPPPPGASTVPISCLESWSCGNWSSCANNLQSRTCTDANSCGTVINRPPLTQSCNSVCTENWSCGAWSQCTNGSQSRTCTDANSCGTTTTRPALTQGCASGGLSCGSACTGCATTHAVATACTTAQRICDGTNVINNISLNVANITVGQNLTVDLAYGCYSGTPPDDNVALWYYNGSSWRLIRYWPAPLTGCDTTANDTDGTLTETFTPDSNLGTHYVRAVLTAGGQPSDPLANSSSCPTTMRYGDVDDLAFTVVDSSPTCNENWSCAAWSTCVDGAQSRTCTDASACGTTDVRPPLTQSCIVPDTTSPATTTDLQ